MADIQKDLENWLRAQPAWLQLAAERYLAGGTLASEDIEGYVTLLKESGNAKPSSSHSFPKATVPAQDARPLRLNSIGSITGIENLGPRIPLDFGAGNLCVVYGHNGSGKSSYTRLLKRMCGKPRAKDLRANVFRPAPSKGSCEIRYSLADADATFRWEANGSPLSDLKTVDVFDSDEAVAYLSNETAVTYVPPAVAMLESLAAFCDRVKAYLQSEQDKDVSVLPSIPPGYATTQVAATWKNLAKSTSKELQALTSWGADDEEALDRLSERLKARDPASLARHKHMAMTYVEHLISHVATLAEAFGEERLTAIRVLRKEAEAKRRNANESAKVTRGELDGIGTGTWRALWQAARAFSQVVYPGQSFPVTEEARCLLCHQRLDAIAQERLNEFEAFVQGKLETEAANAARAHQQVLQQLPVAFSASEVATRCQAADIDAQELVQALIDFAEQAARVRHMLMDGESTETATAVEQPEGLLDALRRLSVSLEKEAGEHEADAARFDRVAVTAAKLELEARRWTSQQSASMQIEVARLERVKAYEVWKKLSSSSGISRKSTELAQKTITDAYVGRFNEELKKLGAAKLKIELVKSKTTKGRVLHKLRLRGSAVPEHLAPDGILSEGERRIITLAAFLADVGDKPYAAPFIFDDPISSLDHDFEWAVATRLAELAKERQVLVFTHRLSFFGAMEDAAKKMGDDWKKAHFAQRLIETYDGVAGHPTADEAFTANTKRANSLLSDRLTVAKKLGDTSGGPAYRAIAQGICTDFRKLLERTVEDDLLNQIVRRHRRSIQTDNRLSVLTRISAEDCSFFDGLMTKYSCFEHSQSSEAPVVIPEATELAADLEALRRWREEYKKRTPAGVSRA